MIFFNLFYSQHKGMFFIKSSIVATPGTLRFQINLSSKRMVRSNMLLPSGSSVPSYSSLLATSLSLTKPTKTSTQSSVSGFVKKIALRYVVLYGLKWIRSATQKLNSSSQYLRVISMYSSCSAHYCKYPFVYVCLYTSWSQSSLGEDNLLLPGLLACVARFLIYFFS